MKYINKSDYNMSYNLKRIQSVYYTDLDFVLN